jgi:hypothetical protein
MLRLKVYKHYDKGLTKLSPLLGSSTNLPKTSLLTKYYSNPIVVISKPQLTKDETSDHGCEISYHGG